MRYPREDLQPWYRQFWTWFIITPPLVGVLLGVLLLLAATSDPDGLVVGDYYKEGRGINQSFERMQFAEHLGLYALVRREGSRVWVELHTAIAIPEPEGLVLSFRHPTRDHADRSAPLLYDAQRQQYVADFPSMQDALWHLQMEPADGLWRLRGRLERVDAQDVRMVPST